MHCFERQDKEDRIGRLRGNHCIHLNTEAREHPIRAVVKGCARAQRDKDAIFADSENSS
jgi:hypothetical protein